MVQMGESPSAVPWAVGENPAAPAALAVRGIPAGPAVSVVRANRAGQAVLEGLEDREGQVRASCPPKAVGAEEIFIIKPTVVGRRFSQPRDLGGMVLRQALAPQIWGRPLGERTMSTPIPAAMFIVKTAGADGSPRAMENGPRPSPRTWDKLAGILIARAKHAKILPGHPMAVGIPDPAEAAAGAIPVLAAVGAIPVVPVEAAAVAVVAAGADKRIPEGIPAYSNGTDSR